MKQPATWFSRSKAICKFVRRRCALCVTSIAIFIMYGSIASAGELLDLQSRPNVTQGAWLDAPSTTPPWIIILFAGDNGDTALSDSGPTQMVRNFVIRTAGYWAQNGDASVIFDAPSDHPGGMSDIFRLSEDAQQDVAAVISVLRQRYPGAKIALIGTSRGTITVGNVLKRTPELADAFVLTSPITIAKGQQVGLSGLDWAGNHAHVLVVSNENDGCGGSPFEAAKDMASNNGFDFIPISSNAGGGGNEGQCGADSPHGFLGIEQSVLDDINNWLNTKA